MCDMSSLKYNKNNCLPFYNRLWHETLPGAAIIANYYLRPCVIHLHKCHQCVYEIALKYKFSFVPDRQFSADIRFRNMPHTGKYAHIHYQKVNNCCMLRVVSYCETVWIVFKKLTSFFLNFAAYIHVPKWYSLKHS